MNNIALIQLKKSKWEVMDKKLIDIKLDKKFFSVISLSDQLNEKDYWLSRSPIERMKHIEVLRRINYGHGATSGLQRVLEFTENKKASGRHKDLDDFDKLP